MYALLCWCDSLTLSSRSMLSSRLDAHPCTCPCPSPSSSSTRPSLSSSSSSSPSPLRRDCVQSLDRTFEERSDGLPELGRNTFINMLRRLAFQKDPMLRVVHATYKGQREYRVSGTSATIAWHGMTGRQWECT